MALDRWIALVILLGCLIYGYIAWFAMDDALPPIMQRNPVWPSTFPKILSVAAVVTALVVILGLEPQKGPAKASEIDLFRRPADYKIGQAVLLLALMVGYALALRPLGFLAATTLFLVAGAAILGERRWLTMIVAGAAGAGIVWALVNLALGILLRPLPEMFG